MSIRSLPKQTPESPGVYIFKRSARPLYVGKAENLRKRLSSYFRKNISEKVRALRAEATKLEWTKLSSDVEALITEAELIKKYQPKYNILMRDDKNYFYVGFTRDEFPKIFVTHQLPTGITNKELGITTRRKKRNSRFVIRNSSFVGPFTSGSALYQTLRILRRIFPYCTCKKFHKRSCLNAEIGRCPGFCCIRPIKENPNKERPLFKWQKVYVDNIRNIAAVLSGKKKILLFQLKRALREAAQKEEFERAAEIRNQIEGIENIFLHRTFLNPLLRKRRYGHDWQKIERTVQTILGTHRSTSRVEGYDISNISGAEATGSIVVFVDGMPSKENYRKFRIKTVHEINDVRMLKEVIRRRLSHPEWNMPDLMLIDGGKPQVNAAVTALKSLIPNSQFAIPVIMGLAKREEELYMPGRKEPIRLDSLPSHTMHFFQHVRDESHRFAKKYHHKLREIVFRNENEKIKK